jgi:iduronate 2-sulfatase
MKWVLLSLCALFIGSGSVTRAAERPNVLFVCVDDLKPVLGCYGETAVKSPNIDRLAASGVRFDRAYCNQAVCAPSRNSLMTGLRPTSIGVYDLETNFRVGRPDAVTMGQWFKQHGYRTEALGKVFHVGHGNVDDAASWSVPHWAPKGGMYVLEENQRGQMVKAAVAGRPPTRRGPAVEAVEAADDDFADGKVAAEAVRRLRAAKENSDEPFFLMVGFVKPHLPFAVPKRYWDMYDRSSFEPAAGQSMPAGAPDFAATPWTELRNYTDVPDTGPLSDDQQRELIHGYHAAVTYLDAQVGRVLDELDRLGLAKNTIVVFWGDHGWHLGDHGMWAKHTNYEQAARIPLVVRAPGLSQDGGVSRGVVESVDLYPTLCEVTGVPRPDGLDGASFAGALKDPADAKTKEAIFHVYPRSPKGMGQILGRAVRTVRHRLIEWKKPGAKADSAMVELYDYQADPAETKNLADEQPDVVARLRAVLADQPEARPQVKVRPAGRDAAN